jgi:hypothetical protein
VGCTGITWREIVETTLFMNYFLPLISYALGDALRPLLVPFLLAYRNTFYFGQPLTVSLGSFNSLLT